MVRQTKNVCIIGFGNAGREFCRILIEKQEQIEKLTGHNIRVTAISTKSKGSLLNLDGIDLELALNEVNSLGRFDIGNPSLFEGSTTEIIQRSEAHIVIELSTLSIIDGQPAITHIESAFHLGAHVITANKGPIAWAYNRLVNMANAKNLQFLYETTVMDGTPVFNLVRETLPGCKILSFRGILNSTTNFILEQMEEGHSLSMAIKEAQHRGFAEADPSLDIDGWDAAAKTAALANVIMGGNLSPMDIDRTGISHITFDDVMTAKNAGKKIKLLCEGYFNEKNILIGKVHPVLVDAKDIFSLIDATSSILSITSDLMGTISIVEQNPEIRQTAYGIYGDLLAILKKEK